MGSHLSSMVVEIIRPSASSILLRTKHRENSLGTGESFGASRLTQRTRYGTFSAEVTAMTTLTASQARARLYKLLDKAASSHEPIQITGKRANAVLISEDDWRSIQETLYLVSIPGVRESIPRGMQEAAATCSEDP